MRQDRDLTEGSILKALFAISLPIVGANILQTIYNLTDTFWVGRLGENAVAAVSLSFPIIFFLISLGIGFSVAGSILVAQYKGRKDQKNIDHVAGQTLLLMVIISAIITIIGLVLSNPLLKLMGAAPDVLPMATSYLQITFAGLILLFAYFVFQALMRGVGDVKTPLYIVLGTVLLNLVLDPLFINGYGIIPAFGVGGAALATIGTQGIGAIIGLFMLFSGNYNIRLKLREMKPDFDMIKKMFKLGFPASLDQSTRALGLTAMIFLVATFGTTIVASYGIGGRILSFVIIPAVGFSIATSTIVGQNIGAGKKDRAEKTARMSSIISFVTLTVIGALIFIFSKQLVAVFIPGNAEIISIGSKFLRIMSLSFGFMGLQLSISGTFRGVGKTTAALMLSIISFWILRFPVAYFLSKVSSLSYNGLWWAFPISNVLAGSIAIIWLWKSDWKHKKLIEHDKPMMLEE